MKKIVRFFTAAVCSAMAAVACSENVAEPSSNGTFTLNFSAEVVEPLTKATLTPDEGETAFAAAWETSDKMNVFIDGTEYIAEWNGASFSISDLPEDLLGQSVTLRAFYPSVTAENDLTNSNTRTQSGAAYNSYYDTMTSGEVTVDINAEGTLIIPMVRNTSVLYFHVSSSETEPLSKAELTVGDRTIVTTLTDVNANDATIWFNVAPGTYGLSLKLTSESGKTAVITRKSDITTTEGKLYKVIKEVTFEGNDEPQETEGDYTWDLSKESFDNATTTQLSWSSTFATVTVDQAGATTATNNYIPKNYTSTRFYKGSLFTLSPLSSYAIEKIEFAATEDSYATALSNSTWTNVASKAVSAQVVTIIPANPKSNVIATIGGTCGFTSIKVYFKNESRTYLLPPSNLQVNQETKTISWDAVEGAGSYDVTVGVVTATVEGTSYAFSGAAGNYDVSVVANSSDESLYISSVPAVLSNVALGFALSSNTSSVVLAYSQNSKSTFEISSNCDWTITGMAGCTVSPASGSAGKTVVTVTASQDAGTGEGEAEICRLVISHDASTSVEVAVNQSYKPSIDNKQEYTVTYKIQSKTSASKISGDAPVGSSVTYSQTYSVIYKSTSDNSATMTLKGYSGAVITKMDFSTHSNASKGAGSLVVTAGTTQLLSISGTYKTAWSSAYTSNYETITPNMTTTTYEVPDGNDVVIKLSCTTNSLYWESVTITYLK